MGGTRFMVFKLKELLKTALFAVLGMIIIVSLIFFLVPKFTNKEAAQYEPGVYTSSIFVESETINVEVTVTEDSIKSIELVHTSETIPVLYPIFDSTMETVANEIVKQQTVSIDIPEDTSYTASLIIDAVSDSLDKATK